MASLEEARASGSLRSYGSLTTSAPKKPAITAAVAAAEPAATAVGSAKAVAAAEKGANVVLIYATVTGTTQQFALKAASVLGEGADVTVLNVEDFEPDAWGKAISESKAVVVMLSTYGPGAPPGTASKFIAWLQSSNGEAKDALKGEGLGGFVDGGVGRSRGQAKPAC